MRIAIICYSRDPFRSLAVFVLLYYCWLLAFNNTDVPIRISSVLLTQIALNFSAASSFAFSEVFGLLIALIENQQDIPRSILHVI